MWPAKKREKTGIRKKVEKFSETIDRQLNTVCFSIYRREVLSEFEVKKFQSPDGVEAEARRQLMMPVRGD